MNNFHHGFIPEHIYHVYNRTNNGELLFLNDSQRQLFLNKLKHYTQDCIDLLAYCLMDNHFHLIVKTKEHSKIKLALSSRIAAYLSKNDLYFINSTPHEYYHSFISKRFSNFFNSYTKCFNLMNGRKGNLFNRAFKRKTVNNEKYLFEVLKYIHNNPVKEDLVEHVSEYYWSSYNSILAKENSFVNVKELLKLVGDSRSFIEIHEGT